MKFNSERLIDDLIECTKYVLSKGIAFQELPLNQLNYKVDEHSWSVLECIEHLNRYGDFYLPEIGSRISSAKESPTEIFRSGFLGNYFAKSMLPKEQLNKMKTFKSMNPMGNELDKSVLTRFISQQKTMLDLLNAARESNLSRVKTSISISKWIKLRLGDTFRVVIYHNQRHIGQAERVLLTSADFG